jgi:hypothetical protein
MIDKLPILNSVTLAIDQSLASLNDDLAVLMQSRVNEIIQTQLDSGDLTNQIQRGMVDFLSTVIDENYKQVLLTRIANNTDQFIAAEFAKTLNDTRQTIAQSLAALNTEMTTKVQESITEMLQNELGQGRLNSKLDIGVVKFLSFIVDENYKQILLSRITQETDTFVATTFAKALREIRQSIDHKATEIIDDTLSTVDVTATIRQTINNVLSDNKFAAMWPKNSIPVDVVDFTSSAISANVLKGGIARNFASTGIADLASTTQVTVLDDRVTVRGDLQVSGNLTLGGLVNTDSDFYRDLNQNLQQATADQVGTLVKNEIKANLSGAITDKFSSGISATAVKFNNVPLVQMGKLNQHVLESNLQKVGRLVELDVGGEVSLFDTVRVHKQRVGINTFEPESTLDIWDQEVQIIIGKKEANTGYIGLGRPGTLRLGVNRNSAITILPDSSVEIPNLRVGQFEKISMTVSSSIPATAGTPGDIIFNNNPKTNGIFAWVCLEGTRWAPVRLDM